MPAGGGNAAVEGAGVQGAVDDAAPPSPSPSVGGHAAGMGSSKAASQQDVWAQVRHESGALCSAQCARSLTAL